MKDLQKSNKISIYSKKYFICHSLQWYHCLLQKTIEDLKIFLVTWSSYLVQHLPAVTFEDIRLVSTQFNLDFFVEAIRSWFVLDHTRGLRTKARMRRCQKPDWNWRNNFGSFCLKTSGSKRCMLRKSSKDAHRPSGGHHAWRLFG